MDKTLDKITNIAYINIVYINYINMENKMKQKDVRIFIFVLGIFVCMLDTTIMNVSLPKIGQNLNVGLDELAWALNVYLILFAALTIPLTRVSEYFGPERGFICGTLFFGIGSLLSAMSDTLLALLIGRGIQSIGAALVFPLAMTLAIKSVPVQKRTGIISLLGITQGIAAALGPTVGGVVTQFLGWRWLFLINVPIVLLMIGLSLKYLSMARESKQSVVLDIPGAILSILFLSCFSVGLMQGRIWGWTDWPTIMCLGSGMIGFILFIIVEYFSKNPMVPLRLFSDGGFSMAAFVIVVSNLFLVATTVILPNYFTNVAGMDTLQASLLITPISIAIFILAPLSGLSLSRVSACWLLSGGFFMMALGYVWLGTGGLGDIKETIVAGLLIGGGYGVITGPILVIAAGHLQGELLTASQSVTGVLRQVGTMLAVAIFVTGLYSNLTLARQHTRDYAQQQIEVLDLPEKNTQHVLADTDQKLKATVFSPKKTKNMPIQLAKQIAKIETYGRDQLCQAYNKLYLITVPFIIGCAIISFILGNKRTRSGGV